jgi:hypothetical protein
MAVTRIILPRKGLIQPQHGLMQYESDLDANWALLDANVAFLSDVQAGVAAPVTVDIPATTAPGAFSVAHNLNRMPVNANIMMTAAGNIFWQDPQFDETNLFLVASDSDLTAKVKVW